ncbi:MAG: GtrA family protein [Niabella sp.]
MLSPIRYTLNFFYPLVRKILTFNVYAYLAVGAANTLLNIVLFIIMYHVLVAFVFAVEAATVISFVITVATGFWLNKNFAFTESSNEKRQKAKQFGKYFLVSLQGQFSDYLITKGLIVLFILHPSVAYILSTVIMLTINYFLQKHFTFKNTSSDLN